MQDSIPKLNTIQTVSLWISRIWFLAWVYVISYITFIFLPKTRDSLPILLFLIVMILGHLLFFFKVRQRVFRFFSLFIKIAGLVFILISIWMLNAEGTTWGAGPASFGLALLLPSLNTFLGASSSRNDQKLGWYILFTGLIGIFITYWRMHVVDQKLTAGLEFWAPEAFYQNLGLLFSFLLVLAGVINLLIKGPRKLNKTKL